MSFVMPSGGSPGRVLVLAAHPDDEVLGCGGTAARCSAEGHEVYVAILGEGVTSRYASRGEAPVDELKMLREQAQQAAARIGARELFHHDLPDNRFDTVPLLDVVKLVEGLVKRLRPDVLFTQHGGDLNVDHQVTFRAAMTATRPTAGHPVRRVYGYEVGSSTEWSFQQFAPPFRPNTFVDVGATLTAKIEAMRIYDGESRPFPHPRSAQALRATAERWGSVAGLGAAEAFELIRAVG